MNDTQTIDAINAHLDEYPTDWAARLELADLYEDAGRLDEARCQRWAARWERAPEFASPNSHESRWHWWYTFDAYPRANIGVKLGQRIQRDAYFYGRQFRYQAEADLMRALVEQGWPAPGVE